MVTDIALTNNAMRDGNAIMKARPNETSFGRPVFVHTHDIFVTHQCGLETALRDFWSVVGDLVSHSLHILILPNELHITAAANLPLMHRDVEKHKMGFAAQGTGTELGGVFRVCVPLLPT